MRGGRIGVTERGKLVAVLVLPSPARTSGDRLVDLDTRLPATPLFSLPDLKQLPEGQGRRPRRRRTCGPSTSSGPSRLHDPVQAAPPRTGEWGAGELAPGPDRGAPALRLRRRGGTGLSPVAAGRVPVRAPGRGCRCLGQAPRTRASVAVGRCWGAGGLRVEPQLRQPEHLRSEALKSCAAGSLREIAGVMVRAHDTRSWTQSHLAEEQIHNGIGPHVGQLGLGVRHRDPRYRPARSRPWCPRGGTAVWGEELLRIVKTR